MDRAVADEPLGEELAAAAAHAIAVHRQDAAQLRGVPLPSSLVPLPAPSPVSSLP
jgi:hypothetical protein